MKCPNCGEENSAPARSWVGGKGTRKPMKVQRFVCSSCGSSYVSWVDSKTGKTKTMARRPSA